MREAVIVDVVRTPVGKGRPGGMLSGWHPVDLLAHTLRDLVARTGIYPATVDDVIVGCVTQAGEQSMNVARNAVLAAGFPVGVPAASVDRQCGSSQQALHFAAQGIMAGAYDVAIAAGVESMSRVPMFSGVHGADPYGADLTARFAPVGGLIPQGVSAELIAARWELDREQLDAYAARSHALADAASPVGIVPTPVDRGEGRTDELATRDEGIRPGSSVETLGGLKAAFRTDELAAAYPEAGWVVTAGNASQISDGASAALVMERSLAERLGLTPRAAVRAFAVVGDDPIFMLTGVIPATRTVLERAGLALDDIDAIEVNEAFASVVLAWQRETGADLEKVNLHGGAIATGHPLGASGTKLLGSLLDVLDERGGRFGLQTMCEGGGMANATILERLS